MRVRVEVFWPIDNNFYAGEFISGTFDGICIVHYDDDDQKTLNVIEEAWLFESTFSASFIQMIKTLKTLESNEKDIINSMMEQLGQRPFMCCHTQGFDPS